MFDEEIRAASEEHEISFALLKAICKAESNINPNATRLDPGWSRFTDAEKTSELCKKTSTTLATERAHQATAWGLMQVMGAHAREMGFEGSLPALCMPEIGLFYGAQRLKKFLNRYSLEDAISAYQAGIPVVLNHQYKNQDYVDDVLRYSKLFDVGEP